LTGHHGGFVGVLNYLFDAKNIFCTQIALFLARLKYVNARRKQLVTAGFLANRVCNRFGARFF